jgi:mannose-6-phosphate isomerase-like protein (cupin superfamily)
MQPPRPPTSEPTPTPQTSRTPHLHNRIITHPAATVHQRNQVEAADSNGSASVFECHVPANSRMPAPHSHDRFEETIYRLEGATTWTIDDGTVDIGPDEVVCVRRGQIHGFQNRGDSDATFLAIATPGVFGPAYFREVRDVLAASVGGPPDHAALAQVMRRHGLTPAPPATS